MNDSVPEDFRRLLAVVRPTARLNGQQRSSIRCVPQPSQALTDALLRCKELLRHYEPSLGDVGVTGLYEYAAARLLHDTVPSPKRMAADFVFVPP